MKRNTDLDFIRAILIMLMIQIHIVSFGTAYPNIKASILSFMMPTFLIITGYLVNIEKSIIQMGKYLLCLALPYVIMVTGFSVLSYFMPVRDGITELTASQICEKIFVTSIGPYWFIQTMIICGVLYYISFKGDTWENLVRGNRQNFSYDTDSTGSTLKDLRTPTPYTSLFIFAILLLLIAQTPALSPSAAAYYFIGVVIRQSHVNWNKLFRPELMALPLWGVLLSHENWHDWGSLAVAMSCWCCISTFTWLHSIIDHSAPTHLANHHLGISAKIDSTLLYIGRNTLPIYLFHPIFTMAAKFYHPLFSFDKSEISFSLFTIVFAIVGSIAIAKAMEVTKTAYIFGKGKILR